MNAAGIFIAGRMLRGTMLNLMPCSVISAIAYMLAAVALMDQFGKQGRGPNSRRWMRLFASTALTFSRKVALNLKIIKIDTDKGKATTSLRAPASPRSNVFLP